MHCHCTIFRRPITDCPTGNCRKVTPKPLKRARTLKRDSREEVPHLPDHILGNGCRHVGAFRE